VAQVQTHYDLPAQLPAQVVGKLPEAQESALRRLREPLAAAEENWTKFCAGSPASLSGFADQVHQVAALIETLGHTDMKRLGKGLVAVVDWLLADSHRFNEHVAMEVATAILLLQHAQEQFKRLGTDFAPQVDRMVARLYACLSGKAVEEADLPALDEISRRAQEKLLLAQVGREIQNNLAQIEQALDAFFRAPGKSHDLGQLQGPIKQVSGALAMLGHFPAVNSLKACAARINEFSRPDYAVQPADFEAVADQLSVLGFFVDALQHGETDFTSFERRLRGEPDAPTPDEPDEDTSAPVSEAPSVETILEQQAQDSRVLAQALRATPDDPLLQANLKQSPEAIRKDADLVADHALEASARSALADLQRGVVPEGELTGQAAALAAATEPDEAISGEEIDAELLSIFIEEARDVLATKAQRLAALKAAPGDEAALTDIRRGAHTLKGSGRMVGLSELGETAWALEQTLNHWLRQDKAATPELLELIEQGHALFSHWVSYLERQHAQVPDPSALVARAAELRGEIVEPAAEIAPPPEAQANKIGRAHV
jgi:chemosensory pili system protein ChpA (sensor histidine kinase/response regulator)